LVSYEKVFVMYQILKSDYEATPWFSNWSNLTVKETPTEVDSDSPIIVGSDLLKPHVRTWLNKKQPGIYIGRGYVGNHLHKSRHWWRYSVNGWANTTLLDIPYPRWHLMKLDRHNWKVKDVKRVLIAPSKMTVPIWDPNVGYGWAEHIAAQFPGAEVKIRAKEKTPWLRWMTLWEDLDWADLVVAQGSAITAEAFWYGKKVISLNPCTTWAAEQTTLEDWKNPKEPELRDAWHEHLAWSQFSNKEWNSGEAINMIEQYVGSVCDYNPGHTYNFK
jgi:hypothetical protein